MISDQTNPPCEALLAVATRILQTVYAGSLNLSLVRLLDSTRSRNLVVRCDVVAQASSAPASVIIKCVCSDQIRHYDPEDLGRDRPAWRLLNEWSGALFLQQLDPDRSSGARVYGVDLAAGVIVLEDLGKGSCLGNLLLNHDADQAEWGLCLYAATLGYIHALAMGRQREFRRLRGVLMPGRAASQTGGQRQFLHSVAQFRRLCAAMQIDWPADLNAEVQTIKAAISAPGPFLTFVPGDICLQNHIIIGDRMRLFDLEFCGFRHALLDAAYLCLPFPTCSTVNRIPSAICERALEAYRSALAKSCPEAINQSQFQRHLLFAHAWWTLVTFGWSDPIEALQGDADWGLASIRQRHLQRSEALAAAADRNNSLPHLAQVMHQVARRLRELWPPQEEMLVYPAFRNSVSSC